MPTRITPIRGSLPARGGPFARGLVGAWSPSAQGMGGDELFDFSGNNRIATSTGTWSQSPYGPVVDLDGGGTKSIVVPTSSAFSGFTTGFTFVSWFTTDDHTDRFSLGQVYNTSGNQRAWLIDNLGTGLLEVLLSANGTAYETWTWDNVFTNSTWYMVTLVWSSGAHPVVYINTSEPTRNSSGTPFASIYASSAVLEFGRSTYSTTRALDGRMGPQLVCNRALTLPEIRTLYANPYCLWDGGL